MRGTTINLLNYFYIGLTLLWQPLQNIIIRIDGKGRTLVLGTFVILFCNLSNNKFRDLLKTSPSIFWLLLCVYAVINLFFCGYHNTSLPFFYFAVVYVFIPCIIMLVVAYEFQKDSYKIVKFLLLILIIYVTLGLLGDRTSNNADSQRMGGTLGNILALNSIFIILFAGILKSWKKMSLTKFVVLTVIAMLSPIFLATRKAFAAALIVLMSVFFSLFIPNLKITFANLLKLILLISSMYLTATLILDYTYIGERFSNVAEVASDFGAGDNLFLQMMGDRAYFYIRGYEVFQDHMLTGIGLGNFQHLTDSYNVLHTEYMVQLCENGIVGTVLFVCFYLYILVKLISMLKKKPQMNRITIIMLGAFLAIVFINFTAWTYSFPIYFSVFGVIIGYIKKGSI